MQMRIKSLFPQSILRHRWTATRSRRSGALRDETTRVVELPRAVLRNQLCSSDLCTQRRSLATTANNLISTNTSTGGDEKLTTSPPRVTLQRLQHDSDNEAIEITIKNGKKLNSLDSALITELTQALRTVSRSQKLRCVVLRGEFDASANKSPAFCAGASLDEMSRIQSSQEAESFISRISTLCTAVRDCPVPVVAAIHGHCYGAGLELAASCDIRYGTASSKFAMPEVAVGIPSVVQARLLVDVMGWANARHMMLLGKVIHADAAHRQGLLNEVFPSSVDMETRIQEDVKALFESGPVAVRVQKTLIKDWERMDVDAGIQAGVAAFSHMWADGGTEPKKYMQKALDRLKSKGRGK